METLDILKLGSAPILGGQFMAISSRCPKCGHSAEFPDSDLGQEFQCLACGHRIKVEMAEVPAHDGAAERAIRLGSRFGVGTRIIMTLACLALATVTLYPPWGYAYQVRGVSQVNYPAPRAFLFWPPSPRITDSEFLGVHLDYGRLIAEWLGIVAVACVLLLVVRILPRDWAKTRARRIAYSLRRVGNIDAVAYASAAATWARRHRKVALATVLILAVSGLALWFSPLLLQYLKRSEVVSDKTTGLMWTASVSKPMPLDQAKEYVRNLREGGYDDWRLPEANELRTLTLDESGGARMRPEFQHSPAGLLWSSEVSPPPYQNQPRVLVEKEGFLCNWEGLLPNAGPIAPLPGGTRTYTMQDILDAVRAEEGFCVLPAVRAVRGLADPAAMHYLGAVWADRDAKRRQAWEGQEETNRKEQRRLQ